MKKEVGGVKITKSFDYKLSLEKNILEDTSAKIELPKSNVLKFILEDGSWFVVRPSGTEPKMKVYMSVIGNSQTDADEKSDIFNKYVMEIINGVCK